MNWRQLLLMLAMCNVWAECLGATSYTYDVLNRLTGVDFGNGNSISYTYDAAGNRLSMTVVGSSAAPGSPTGVGVVGGNGSATITFTPPGSDGGSAITGYTATANPGGNTGSCTAPCTSITVSGLANGTTYTFTVIATSALGSSAPSVASATVIPVNRIYTASDPVLPAAGSITAVLSGGGAGCSFGATQYIPVTGSAHSPGTSPTYVQFPYGLFDVTTVGCTVGSTVTVTLTYPETLAKALQYWQYGKTSGNPSPHWYVQAATISGNQAIASFTDAGVGDDDLTSNGSVASVGGLGIAPWDVFWRNSNGTNATWQFYGTGPAQFASGFPPGVPSSWQAKGTGDLNGDGIPEVVWFEPTFGLVATWLMSSPAAVTNATFPGAVGAGSPWVLSRIGDVNGDGRADLVWRHSTTGQVLVWLLTPTGYLAGTLNHGTAPLNYELRGIGDFNGDGIADLLWFDPSNGVVALWLMQANGTHTGAFPGAVGPGSWRPHKVGDFDGDGKADIFWRNEANGMTAVWYLNGGSIAASDFFLSVPMASWTLGSVGDYDADGRDDLLWVAPGAGNVVRWLMQGRHVAPLTQGVPGVGAGWQMVQ